MTIMNKSPLYLCNVLSVPMLILFIYVYYFPSILVTSRFPSHTKFDWLINRLYFIPTFVLPFYQHTILYTRFAAPTYSMKIKTQCRSLE